MVKLNIIRGVDFLQVHIPLEANLEQYHCLSRHVNIVIDINILINSTEIKLFVRRHASCCIVVHIQCTLNIWMQRWYCQRFIKDENIAVAMWCERLRARLWSGIVENVTVLSCFCCAFVVGSTKLSSLSADLNSFIYVCFFFVQMFTK